MPRFASSTSRAPQVPQLRRDARRWVSSHCRQLGKRQPGATLVRAEHDVSKHVPLRPHPSPAVLSFASQAIPLRPAAPSDPGLRNPLHRHYRPSRNLCTQFQLAPRVFPQFFTASYHVFTALLILLLPYSRTCTRSSGGMPCPQPLRSTALGIPVVCMAQQSSVLRTLAA